jgi:hypothetical protein
MKGKVHFSNTSKSTEGIVLSLACVVFSVGCYSRHNLSIIISGQALLLSTVGETDFGYSYLAASVTSLFKSESTFPFHVCCPFLNQFCSFTFQQCSVDCHTCTGIINSSVQGSNTDMADTSNEGRSTVAQAA